MNYIGGLSNKLYRRVVQQINLIGGCPINSIGGLSNKLYRRLSNEFSKKKNLLF